MKSVKSGNRILHIHCGDTSAESLRDSRTPGEVIVWHDPVMEGPTPRCVNMDAYQRMRAQYFVEAQCAMSFDQALQGLREQHDILAKARDFAEIVLWFDACLFDQTIMIQVMDRISRIDRGAARLSLVCIGEHPEISRFVGLGELDARQMGELFKTRHEVSGDEMELARKAWGAFCSDNPLEIEVLLSGDCAALPYLWAALRRHLEQYPSMRNGMNRLQNEVLTVIASGIGKLGNIFQHVSNREERPFLGDITLWRCIDDMARCKRPALKVDGPGFLRRPLWEPIKDVERWTVQMTDTGRTLFEGRIDWIKLNGIDRWLGGVHLFGDEVQWRWDERVGKIARMKLTVLK